MLNNSKMVQDTAVVTMANK